jgi:hypothetical protein
MADFGVLTPSRRTRVLLRGAVLPKSPHLKGFRPACGPKRGQTCTFRYAWRELPRLVALSRSPPNTQNACHHRIASQILRRHKIPLRFTLCLLVLLALRRASHFHTFVVSLSSLLTASLSRHARTAPILNVRIPPRRASWLLAIMSNSKSHSQRFYKVGFMGTSMYCVKGESEKNIAWK